VRFSVHRVNLERRAHGGQRSTFPKANLRNGAWKGCHRDPARSCRNEKAFVKSPRDARSATSKCDCGSGAHAGHRQRLRAGRGASGSDTSPTIGSTVCVGLKVDPHRRATLQGTLTSDFIERPHRVRGPTALRRGEATVGGRGRQDGTEGWGGGKEWVAPARRARSPTARPARPTRARGRGRSQTRRGGAADKRTACR